MGFPSDLEIARGVKPKPIGEVATALGFHDDEVEPYGRTKAKLSIEGIERLEKGGTRGKYVVVTAISPTPLGEGKTTTTVGLAQGLNKIGHRAAVAIRQPSLGPVFGIKGGAGGLFAELFARLNEQVVAVAKAIGRDRLLDGLHEVAPLDAAIGDDLSHPPQVAM